MILVILLIILILVFLLMYYRKSSYTDVKIFVISIPGSKRREKVTEEFKKYNLDFEFFDGVKVENKEYLFSIYDKLDIKYREYVKPDGQVGVLLAYLSFMKYAIDNNLDNILLCEDDITFIPEEVEYFKNNKHEFINKCDWLMVHRSVVDDGWGIQAQVISLECAKKMYNIRDLMLERLKDTPIDLLLIWRQIDINVCISDHLICKHNYNPFDNPMESERLVNNNIDNS